MTLKGMAHCKICGGELFGILCERCSHVQVSQPEKFLQEGMKVGKRYLVGRIVYCDDEASYYWGEETKTKEKVLMIEFFPQSLAIRNLKNKQLSPEQGKEVQFKTLMADFEYLYQQLMKISEDKSIPHVIDLLQENGTYYAICSYAEVITIKKHLEKRQKPYLWQDIRYRFLQLCKTVNLLHAKGIVHRGISPYTVLVNEEGALVLWGMSTSANRTRNSEIIATLFEGYAALEQYHHNMWQGNWTDIFALGALLYRILTGETPCKNIDGEIVPANECNPSIPKHVSEAIRSAMVEKYELRLQSVDEFTAMLLEDSATNTAIFTAPETRAGSVSQNTMVFQELPQYPPVISADTLAILSEMDSPQKRQTQWSCYLRFTALCTVAVIICWVFSQLQTYLKPIELPLPEPPKLTFETHTIQDFSTHNVKALIEDSRYEEYIFHTVEVFHDTIPTGVVIEQFPPAGIVAVNKVNIILQVSKGKESVTLPNLLGLPIETAVDLLQSMEIRYQIFEVVDPTMEEGVVGRINFHEGSKVNLYRDTVYLFTKRKIPVKEEQSSVPSSQPQQSEQQEEESSEEE